MKFVFFNDETEKNSKMLRDYFLKTKSKPACENTTYRKKEMTNKQSYILYGTMKKEKLRPSKFYQTIFIKQVVSTKSIKNDMFTINSKNCSIISKTMDKLFGCTQQQSIDSVLFFVPNSYLLARKKARKRCEWIHNVTFTSSERTRPHSWYRMNVFNECRSDIIEQHCFIQSFQKEDVNIWTKLSILRCTSLLC